MADEYISSAAQEQQQPGSMTLLEFAAQEGLNRSQAIYLAQRGRILGARRTHGGRWLVFPPAKLAEPLRKRTTWRDRSPDAVVSQEIRGAVGLHSREDGFAVSASGGRSMSTAGDGTALGFSNGRQS